MPLRKLKEPLPNRNTILFHQIKMAVFHRNDQREVWFFDDTVNARRAVSAFDLIFPNGHPPIAINRTAADSANAHGWIIAVQTVGIQCRIACKITNR